MLRVCIVMPIYLLAAYFIPRSGLLELVPAFLTQGVVWHALVGYAIAAIVAGIIVWRLDHRVSDWAASGVFLISEFRMFFIGVVVTSFIEWYYLLTASRIDTFSLFIPLVFFLAEMGYELAESLISLVRRD